MAAALARKSSTTMAGVAWLALCVLTRRSHAATELCEAGALADVICGGGGATESGGEFTRPRGEGLGLDTAVTGCLQTLGARVLETEPGRRVLELLRGGDAQSERWQDDLRRGEKRHQAVSWLMRTIGQSCDGEAKARQLSQTGCRDRASVPVLISKAGDEKDVACEAVVELCGLGLNVESFCPATCGLCGGATPAEHFWGRLRGFNGYYHYVGTQQDAMHAKLLLRDAQWVSQADVQFLAGYLRRKFPLARRQGLCHGTRQGREQQWFMEALPGFEVWGTEISEYAKRYANTISPFDYHWPLPDWDGRADFVYSNALDHSYDPPLAIRRWMQSLAPNGALIIDFSFVGDDSWQAATASDPYQATMAQLQRLILLAGPFEICDVLRAETPAKEVRAWLVASHEGAAACQAELGEASRYRDMNESQRIAE